MARTASFTVIVPTYKRAMELRRCLGGLALQTVRPLEVIVVLRDIDAAAKDVLREPRDPQALPLKVLEIDRPGVIAALNLALDNARGEFVAMTDDDAVPHPDWIEKLDAAFAAFPDAGGIGGRDVLTLPDNPPPAELTETVGLTTWYGRGHGNFHRGKGPPRKVQSLKGVNMAYRMAAVGRLRFDDRLKGHGAQVSNEALFSGAIRCAGWDLIYDPAIRVEHIVGERPRDTERNRMDGNVLREATHNAVLGLFEHHRPWTVFSSLAYTLLIGSWNAPGLLSALRGTLKGRRGMWTGLRNNYTGAFDGWRTYVRTRTSRGPDKFAVPRRSSEMAP